jgi:hypothetical protein
MHAQLPHNSVFRCEEVSMEVETPEDLAHNHAITAIKKGAAIPSRMAISRAMQRESLAGAGAVL